jgi:hypothetical protein
MKENIIKRVMAVMGVSPNVNIVVAVNEKCLMWTMYNNLFKRFILFKAFLINYGFATPRNDSKHHPIFNERML